MTPEAPVQALEEHVGVALRYAYQRACANLVAGIGALDLTPTQYSVLVRLDELGPVSQNRLGRSIAMEPANIRDNVRRLGARGLVALAKDPEDRRVVMVSLSDAGRRLLARARPLADGANAGTLACMSEEEQALLFELLARISAA
jgi:MarR family transcriptional regulator, lower aerobic nicotinate degradation pathway regulator